MLALAIFNRASISRSNAFFFSTRAMIFLRSAEGMLFRLNHMSPIEMKIEVAGCRIDGKN